MQKEPLFQFLTLFFTTTMLTFLVTLLLPIEILSAKDMPERAGWVEEVLITPGSLRLNAKLDTGAKSSSLHAENLSSFSRDGAPWVKFDVIDEEGKPVSFERKVHRIGKIKRHNQKS